MSFIWTNALIVGAITFLLFTFIDPAEIAIQLQLSVDEGAFRIKAYIFTFLGLWILFNVSTFLNCYYSELRTSNYVNHDA
jgi:hypothetical protein